MSDVTATLGPGEAIVFFTDGVTEARGDDDFFEDDRLSELLGRLRHEDAQGIAQGLVDVVVEFQNGLPRDDIAVLVAKVPGG